MIIIQKKKLLKYKSKNIGNKALTKSIDDFIKVLEDGSWKTKFDVQDVLEADLVHKGDFYIIDLTQRDRTLVLIKYEDNMAKILWCGNHDDYERILGNNKNTIKKVLRELGEIE